MFRAATWQMDIHVVSLPNMVAQEQWAANVFKLCEGSAQKRHVVRGSKITHTNSATSKQRIMRNKLLHVKYLVRVSND